ncbi:MAG: hypothetical protein V7721_00860 [Porticoccaceae bacterium]
MLYGFLTKEQNQTITKAIDGYRGQAPTLESALGAVLIGHRYGWRVLKVIHSPATYKKYEKILGVKFQDICPERGPKASRSMGLKIADRLNSFWAVATGKKKIPNKAMLDDGAELPEDFTDE